MSLVFNNYDDSIADPVTFKQLAVKDALFLYYKCPQVDKQMQLFSHYNEIMFTCYTSRWKIMAPHQTFLHPYPKNSLFAGIARINGMEGPCLLLSGQLF
jgi:hypothetical protein